MNCSVGSCGFGGDGLLELDWGACPGSPNQGRLPLVRGQRLQSDGLALSLLTNRGQAFQLQAGKQRWRLLATPQALWALRRSVGAGSGRWAGTWLGFRPTGDQQRWLRRHQAKDSMGVDL